MPEIFVMTDDFFIAEITAITVIAFNSKQ